MRSYGARGLSRLHRTSEKLVALGAKLWFAKVRRSKRERALDLCPVDQHGQPHQRVGHVDLLVQSWTEQLGHLRLRRLRDHGVSGAGTGKTIPCKCCILQPEEMQARSRACALFRADSIRRSQHISRRMLTPQPFRSYWSTSTVAAVRNDQLMVVANQVRRGLDVDLLLDIAERESNQLVWNWAKCWKSVEARNARTTTK